MDLGECPQIHDLALRADYEAAQVKKDHFYDIDVSIDHFTILQLCYNCNYLLRISVSPTKKARSTHCKELREDKLRWSLILFSRRCRYYAQRRADRQFFSQRDDFAMILLLMVRSNSWNF